MGLKKRPLLNRLAGLGLATALGGLAVAAAAQDVPDFATLRGEIPITEAAPAPSLKKQNTNPGSMARAYRQQPPLIPHRVHAYQITTTVNKCMSCHDWPFNVQEGAPKISETHYVDRNGVALDKLAASRWFCTQCHVPQVNARELVRNDFRSSIEVD